MSFGVSFLKLPQKSTHLEYFSFGVFQPHQMKTWTTLKWLNWSLFFSKKQKSDLFYLTTVCQNNMNKWFCWGPHSSCVWKDDTWCRNVLFTQKRKMKLFVQWKEKLVQEHTIFLKKSSFFFNFLFIFSGVGCWQHKFFFRKVNALDKHVPLFVDLTFMLFCKFLIRVFCWGNLGFVFFQKSLHLYCIFFCVCASCGNDSN